MLFRLTRIYNIIYSIFHNFFNRVLRKCMQSIIEVISLPLICVDKAAKLHHSLFAARHSEASAFEPKRPFD